MSTASNRRNAGCFDLGPPLSRRRLLALIGGGAAGAALGACSATPPTSFETSSRRFLQLVQRGDAPGVGRMLATDARLVRVVDGQGRSAFVLAHLSGHGQIGELLRERGLELDLVEAVLAADWPLVEQLAAADSRAINRSHPIGGNPLYASALVGGAEQYRLRSLGCDSDGRPVGGSGFSPARAAMQCRDPVGALLAGMDILSNGGDPNVPQARGDSVLHGAVRARDTRLVAMVLRKGGDPYACDEHGRRPLDLARELEWAPGVELLERQSSIARDHRASRFAFDQSRQPFVLDPLDDVSQAAQSEITGLSHFNRARVAELLAAEPRLVHAISADDELAIEACGHTGQAELIQVHLDHGAPLSLPTAISVGDLQHARWLLAQDPLLIHERGPHDFAVMWYPAIGGGSVEAAELLLEYGADLEQESGGETALHLAAWRGHDELVRYLVQRGARIDAVGYRQVRAGATPLDLALAGGHERVAASLREL
ncbi:ankyrin repeat domain-containing protein [Engelhardtia mirabilis]|uniref:Ankyrin repeats (3 copies) n=1 Tax=Engelhardtia mirabilis TaxID=2528011 RepID=A0A518BMD9_9BACT|nr:Ankyrin repeats (3 copies) [Planctomycetes bacterium Pla133]QDV02475.1 Ankyrin repeats (3 copies) [Planctomycetes bacterium Pla86]